jgi:DNA-binding transcriptional LysR family regulator
MQSLRGILNFTRAAQLGSFAAAGRELDISAVAVSQNISRLEQALGVRLFARSTRALTLTREGEAFLEQCTGPLQQLAQACQSVADDAAHPSGVLRASVVSPLAFLYLIPRLSDFYKRYPDITLELELSEDSMPLIPKKFDVGIRVGTLNDAEFVARPLGPMRLLLCASPDYLKQSGIPLKFDDLYKHKTLQLRITGREQPTPFFLQSRADGARSVQMFSRAAAFVSNDFRSLLAACEAGLGIAQLPQPLALSALKKGQLMVVLPQLQVDGWQLFIHYPSRKQLPARVRVFVDFCIEQFGGHADLTADTRNFVAPGTNRPQL